MRYAWNFIRSAIAPATIVAAAPQNAAWKSQNARSGTPEGFSAEDESPTPRQPTKPLPPPNISAYPTRKKAKLATQ